MNQLLMVVNEPKKFGFRLEFVHLLKGLINRINFVLPETLFVFWLFISDLF